MYESFQLFAAVAVILATIYFLARQYETRMVLLGAGIVLCCIAFKPLMALDGFVKSMVTSGLIQNICSALGFAYVMKATKCDEHLVRLLLKPVKNIGFFLIPVATLLTWCINIAIPSAAGCAAAVGATMIPLLMAAGVRPAMAAAAVFAGSWGSIMSPGLSHTAVISNLTGLGIMDIVATVTPYALGGGAIAVVGMGIMAFLYKDYNKAKFATAAGVNTVPGAEAAAVPAEAKEPINVFFAFAPLLPLVLLIVGYLLRTKTNLQVELKDYPTLVALLKIGVPQAMILGAIYGLLVTRSSPSDVTKKFFNGMGEGYANVMGIIIAASVFAAGLQASGAITWFIGELTTSPNFARWGSTLGPFMMGLISGSGDAAAMAFNNSITPHAEAIGYDKSLLGMAAAYSGALGRTGSPIAGAAIVCAGLANVNPLELAKRTAPVMAVIVVVIALWML
jgi:DcuC family C4-dicarboxylate transporter